MVPVVEILMHAYMAKPAPPAPLWPGAARIQRDVVGRPGRTRRVDAESRTVADDSIPCRLATVTLLVDAIFTYLYDVFYIIILHDEFSKKKPIIELYEYLSLSFIFIRLINGYYVSD